MNRWTTLPPSLLSSTNLCPCLDELQQIRPGFIELVFPFCNGGSISVAVFNQGVRHLVDTSHTVRADVVSVAGKLGESVLQHLER